MSDEERRLAKLEEQVAEMRQQLAAVCRIVDDLQVDVNGIIRELRVHVLPGLLPGRSANVGHGAMLRAVTRRAIRQQTAADARAAKQIGDGKGSVKSLETKRRFKREARQR